MTLFIDAHEPENIRLLIAQAVEMEVSQLNIAGMADYVWMCVDGHTAQVERKQWGEVLGGMNDVEDQLRRELARADDLTLLIEGVAVPSAVGMEVWKSVGKSGWKLARSWGSREKPQPQLYARVCGWLWALDKAGITIVHTHSYVCTAMWVVEAYKQSQREEHRVLERYVRVKLNTTERDPMVQTLMGIKGVSLGEVRARALRERFGSVYRLVNGDLCEVMEVEGFGEKLSRQVLRSLGRMDV